MGELDFLAEVKSSRLPASLVVARAAKRKRRWRQWSLALTLGFLLVGLAVAAVVGRAVFFGPSDGAAQKAGPASVAPPAIAKERPPTGPSVPTVSKQQPAAQPDLPVPLMPAALGPAKPAAPKTEAQSTADAIGLGKLEK
jgi:hypothetical protein